MAVSQRGVQIAFSLRWRLRFVVKVAAVALTILALSSAAGGLALPDATAETRSDHVTLHVGTIDEMKTRNPLHPWAADPWTEDVLARVYEGVLLRHPESDGPMAYIAKGVDTDEDGLFEPASEYDVWEEKPGAATPLSVVAYYDFNGVRWHDGGQVTVWDLMFSYHLNAMHPRFNESLRALLCAPNVTYDACDRQVNIATAAKNCFLIICSPFVGSEDPAHRLWGGFCPTRRLGSRLTLTAPRVPVFRPFRGRTSSISDDDSSHQEAWPWRDRDQGPAVMGVRLAEGVLEPTRGIEPRT